MSTNQTVTVQCDICRKKAATPMNQPAHARAVVEREGWAVRRLQIDEPLTPYTCELDFCPKCAATPLHELIRDDWTPCALCGRRILLHT